MTEITIRPAHNRDAELLAKLVITVQQLHIENQPERFKPLKADNPALIAVYEGHLADDNKHIYIAEIEGVAVGFILCVDYVIPENPFVYSKRDFHIDQISVDVDYQGQGIGKLLMQQAIREAQECEADLITLGVASFNQQAIEFYKNFRIFNTESSIVDTNGGYLIIIFLIIIINIL